MSRQWCGGWVEDVEPRLAQKYPCDQLADQDRRKRPAARCKQWIQEAGGHQQSQLAEHRDIIGFGVDST